MSGNYRTLVLAAAMGILAGMRSMAAPALLSHRFSRGSARNPGFATRLLGSRRAAAVLKVFAAGEMIADKTPYVPDRTELPSIVGRALSGALCGAAIAEWRGDPAPGAVLAGSCAAIGSTYLMYTLRKRAGEASNIPDPVLGALEDSVVLSAGTRITDTVG